MYRTHATTALGTNVLFRHPLHVPAAEWAAPDAARDGLGERDSPRAARSTFCSPTGSGRGPGGRCGLPSPPAPLPHCGSGVIWVVASASLQDTGAGSPLLRSPPPSSPAARERKGGWGEGEGASRVLHDRRGEIWSKMCSTRLLFRHPCHKHDRRPDNIARRHYCCTHALHRSARTPRTRSSSICRSPRSTSQTHRAVA